jgi:hypothetical protein
MKSSLARLQHHSQVEALLLYEIKYHAELVSVKKIFENFEVE